MTKRTRIGRVQLWAVVVGLLAPAAVLAAASPSNALQAGCAPDPMTPGTILCVYTPTNTPADFVVPPGVNLVSIRAFGARGGSSAGVLGGSGSIVSTDASVNPGDVLSVNAGRRGLNGAAGANVPGGAGGGTGGAGDSAGGKGGNTTVPAATGGGGGGGASTVVFTDNFPPPASPIYAVVAGGGGGAGGRGTDGLGGVGGSALNGTPAGGPGAAGTGTNPGAGGAGGVVAPPGPALTPGPPGGASTTGGGGGGAGGGSAPGSPGGAATGTGGGGGGGAGASFPVAGATWGVNPFADGRVELRYTPCVAPSQVVLGNAVVREGDAGPTPLEFPITVVNPSACTDVIVNLQAGGPGATATIGSDYTVPDFSILIPAGQSSGVFTVLVNGDTQIERDEFLFARIVSVVVPGASEPAPPPTFNPRPRIGIIRNDDGVIIDCIPGEPLPAGYNVIVGTNGDDDIAGSPGDDIIFGLRGNDRIVGDGGDDILCGGPGRDRLAGGVGDDQLSGDAGPDILLGGDGNDTMVGGPGFDVFAGGAGVDTQTP